MERLKYSVGIDVDKKAIKVCLLCQDVDNNKKVKGSHTFTNDKKGFMELLKWAGKLIKKEKSTVNYVLEATGVYHEHLAHYLYSKSKAVYVLLPLKSKRYIQSLGIRSKTDKIDARGLATMGSEQTLEKWQPSSTNLIKLRSLTRQIEALKDNKTSFNNQLEGATHSAVMHPKVIKSLKEMIKQLEKQIGLLEAEVGKMVMDDPILNKKYRLIAPLKGVGLMSFAVVVSETDGFTLFKNQRQLVCYSGYDILENQSGSKAGKTRISKKGNSHIRRILHMASLCVVKAKVAPFSGLYERIYERSGIKMKGYVAVQRKLLVMLYTLWKKDESFDPEFLKSKTTGIQEPKSLFSVGPIGTKKQPLFV